MFIRLSSQKPTGHLIRPAHYPLVLGMVLSTAGTALAATAGTPSPDKSQYNLFHPTPRELRRDLSADRPDATESPITVDAGAVQLEISFFEFGRDSYNHSHETAEAWSSLVSNVKVGLTNDTDLQFVFSGYTEERTSPDTMATTTLHGFGDVQIRVKHNLWGNDGGPTALGIMPFIKVPVETELSNGKVEGGLIASFGMDLTETVGLGFQGEIDGVYDESDKAYDLEFAHTAVLGAELFGPFGGYVEYLGIVSSDSDTEYKAIGSTGLTWTVSSDVVLDMGTRIGLNRAAEDLVVFAGMTVRF